MIEPWPDEPDGLGTVSEVDDLVAVCRLLATSSTRQRFDLLCDMIPEQGALIELVSQHGGDSNR